MELTTETPVEIGRSSRRVCMRIPGTCLCLKRYRDDDEVGASVRCEIASSRHDRRRNICAQEYDYFQSLKARLSPETLSAFPEVIELRNSEKHGWCLAETLVMNGDGSVPEKFSRVYRRASVAQRRLLYVEFRRLMHEFESAAVRFYNPQNVIVQWPGRPFEGADFRLRIVDFEPTSRALLPLDLLSPALCRRKLRRRVKRYLWNHIGVKYNPLPWRERASWDAFIKAEGAKIGLTRCRAFLENKLVNDIFYEGLFNGRPCIVKCSSRAPESIVNEYEVSRRLHAADPLACAEPYAYWLSPDGRKAFVVLERLRGPSFMELLSSGFGGDVSLEERVAYGMLRIARALQKADVVWRDILHDNFMMDESGNLRLVDAQFAAVRNGFREDPYLRRHWKYRISVFANHPDLCGRGWNDVSQILHYLRHLHPTPSVECVRSELAGMADDMVLRVKPSASDLARAAVLLFELVLRFPFARGGRKERIQERIVHVIEYIRGEHA